MLAIALGLLMLGAASAGAGVAQPTLAMVMLPGGTSHHMQAIGIARVLRGRGWRTSIVLPDFDAGGLAAKGLLEPGLEPVVFSTQPNSNDHYEAMLARIQGKPREFVKLHTEHFEALCRQLLADGAAIAALRGLAADLLLLDIAFACTAPLAELLGVPTVLLSPVDVADPFWSRFMGLPYTTAVHGFLGSGMAPPLSFGERLVNTLVSPLIFALGSRVTRASAARIAREFNLSGSTRAGDAFRAARLVLLNAAPGVSTPRSLPPNVKAVGPLLVGGQPKPLPAPLAGILERAGPPGAVYVSFGTTFRPGCDVARGLAAALAALNRTVVLNLSPARLPADCPLASLPPSVHVVPWAPQADLLGHPQLRAFVSHGGVNSLYEAAYRGIPLVCVPLAADQYDCCAKAVKGGWGLHMAASDLSVATAPQLAALIERVAAEGSPLRARAAAVSAVLSAHPRPALERVADWMEYALALPDGTNLSDPAMLMPWWRRQCLDVYAAVAAAAAALLATMAASVRWAWLRAACRLARAAKKDD